MRAEAFWSFLWNLGVVVGMIGLPAMLGFYAGAAVDAAAKGMFPWRLAFTLLGALVGALAAWRTLAPKRARPRD